MERHELQELHYITPICNVSSILQHGILSHVRAAGLNPESVAMQEMQDRRARIHVPGGRPLHEYANLYICGRNPMLYKRLSKRDELCVLAIDTAALDLPGAIVTDKNAGGDYVQFRPAPLGLVIVNKDRTFAEYWTDPDPIEYWRKKAAKCAEVLVPDRVDPRFVVGVYVSCEQAQRQVEALGLDLPVSIQQHLFFL
ncbi:MAG: hypothetical protein A2Y76_07310 [Planctomycetes bacterium RBG_13_60_9]|nr:MAG: hypothetical protein A2Y76_07310 [Planctomycetes bacterium RBG_13_60_9]